MIDRDAATTPLLVSPMPASDDYGPRETAIRLLDWSQAKARLPLDRLVVLGLMAGVFIALGGAFFTLVMTEVQLSHGPSRLLGGVAFSMGLLFVAMTGSELSTGNCLGFTALAGRQVSAGDLTRVLLVSFVANMAGALLLACLMVETGLLDGAAGEVAARVAEAKLDTTLLQAYFRGVLCNLLVCLAVWMILAARTLVGKMTGLVLPIAAFVALGFEHVVANAYLLPVGLMAGAQGSLSGALCHLGVVALGNLFGGMILAMAIWFGYLRPASSALPVGHIPALALAGARRGAAQ